MFYLLQMSLTQLRLTLTTQNNQQYLLLVLLWLVTVQFVRMEESTAPLSLTHQVRNMLSNFRLRQLLKVTQRSTTSSFVTQIKTTLNLLTRQHQVALKQTKCMQTSREVLLKVAQRTKQIQTMVLISSLLSQAIRPHTSQVICFQTSLLSESALLVVRIGRSTQTSTSYTVMVVTKPVLVTELSTPTMVGIRVVAKAQSCTGKLLLTQATVLAQAMPMQHLTMVHGASTPLTSYSLTDVETMLLMSDFLLQYLQKHRQWNVH